VGGLGGPRPNPSCPGPWSVEGTSRPGWWEGRAPFFRLPCPASKLQGQALGGAGPGPGGPGAPAGAYLGQAERGRIHPGRGGRRRAAGAGARNLLSHFSSPPPLPSSPPRALRASPAPASRGLPVSVRLSSFPALSVCLSLLPLPPRPNFSPLPPRSSHFLTSNFQRNEGKKSARGRKAPPSSHAPPSLLQSPAAPRPPQHPPQAWDNSSLRTKWAPDTPATAQWVSWGGPPWPGGKMGVGGWAVPGCGGAEVDF
jgi:hypothetical protein